MDAFSRVLAEPGSTAARKALAAEWKAKGDPRAELIENQLAYREYERRGVTSSDEARALDKWITVATRDRGKAWAGQVATLVDEYTFHRGLVAEVTLSGEKFTVVAPKLFALAPIQHVNLTAPLGSVAALVESPFLVRLASLKIAKLGGAFGDAGAIVLARSPQVAKLSWLALRKDAIGEKGVEALAASPYLERVAYLGLEENPSDPTPYVHEFEGVYTPGRPALAAELERTFGARPWLAVPTAPESWPPDRDELAVTR